MKILVIFLLFGYAIFLVSLSFHTTHAYFLDSATSTNNTFVAASTFPTITGTVTPTPALGDVIINEINWEGNNTQSSDEWIELRNTTNHEIDLSGWKVIGLGIGGNTITITSGKTIAANGYFLLTNLLETDSNSRLNIPPDMQTSSVSLLDSGEQLVLQTSASITIDLANLTATSWFAGIDTIPNKSMERNSTPGNGTSALDWHDATTSANMDIGATELGTPKATNGL